MSYIRKMIAILKARPVPYSELRHNSHALAIYNAFFFGKGKD